MTAAAAAASVDVDRGTAGAQVVPRRRGYSSQPKKARPLPRSTRASRDEESEKQEELQRAVAHANERVDAFARRVGLELSRLIELNRGMPGARGGRLRGSDRLRAGTQLNTN